MKFDLNCGVALVALAAASLPSMAEAQGFQRIQTCGTASPPAGVSPGYMDVDGNLCTGAVFSGTVVSSGTVTLNSGTNDVGTIHVAGTVPVSGTITSTPSGTQTVAGTVAVSGTVPVSGTVAVSGTVPVSGTVALSGTSAVSGTVTTINSLNFGFVGGTSTAFRSTATINGTTAATLVAAVASLHTYVTALKCFRTDTGTTLAQANLNDTASWPVALPQGGGSNETLPVPLISNGTNTAITISSSAGITGTCAATGYTGT